MAEQISGASPTGAQSANTLPIHRSLSGNYFMIARIFIDKARQIEEDYKSGKLTAVDDTLCCEHMGYALNSIISAVMAFESFTNEQMYLCDSEGLPKCHHKHEDPTIEKKICAIVQHFQPDAPPYDLSSSVQHIIFLRNQYVHYDFEGVTGDIISNPLADSEKRLDDVLLYFEPMFAGGKIERNALNASEHLFPMGLLSASFANWCLIELLKEVKTVMSKSEAPLPGIIADLFDELL